MKPAAAGRRAEAGAGSTAELPPVEGLIGQERAATATAFGVGYAILRPCDYLDIFEAPDETIAAKVVMIIRSYGHGQTETWTAMPWERFEIVLPA